MRGKLASGSDHLQMKAHRPHTGHGQDSASPPWRTLRFLAVALGACFVWADSPEVKPDTISYLDIGDAFMAGDWSALVNGCWSPIYPVILGLATHLSGLPRAEEVNAVRCAHMIIYLAALASFDLLLRSWLDFLRLQRAEESSSERRPLPDAVAVVVAYLLFLSASLFLIGPLTFTPDMCVAVAVNFACAMLVRIHTRVAPLADHVRLGIALGFGYLSKAAMFPLSFVFMALSLKPRVSRSWPVQLFFVLTSFGLIAGPLVAALSFQLGRLTFGDAGRINYAVRVNGVLVRYWQGDEPGTGTPTHPPRKLHDTPDVYEFASPIGGTQPLLYDLSYWNEGREVRFDLTKQLSALRRSATRILAIFGNPTQLPWLALLLGGSALLLHSRSSGAGAGRVFVVHTFLLVPWLAAAMLYSLVAFNARYIGPFMIPFALAIIGGIRIPDTDRATRGAVWLLLLVGIAFAVSLSVPITKRIARLSQYAVHGYRLADYKDWKIAEALHGIGVRAGDQVACIGDSVHVYWARLAGVRVVADVPNNLKQTSQAFWGATPAVRREVLRLLGTSGARVVVAGPVPSDSPIEGWTPIVGTDYFVRNLTALSD